MAVQVTRSGVGLIIGIIILAIVIIGGLYIVKQRGDTARRDANMKIAQQRLKDESTNKVALNDGDQSSQNQGSSNSSNSSNQSQNSSQNGSNGSANNGNAQSATQLPQTGPTDTPALLGEVALLAFAVASYLSSRKARLTARQLDF